MIKIKSDKIIIGETLFDGYMYALNGKITELRRKINLQTKAMILLENMLVRALLICTRTAQADTLL